MKIVFAQVSQSFHDLVKSSSKNKDVARKEYILNILIVASIVLIFIAFSITFREDYILKEARVENSSIIILIVLFIYVLAFWLSKKGRSNIVSIGMVSIYYMIVTQSVAKWGPDMPVGLLTYGLLIVMSGILVSSRFALLLTVLISTTLITLTILNLNNMLSFHQEWKFYPVMKIDVFIFCIIFFLIAVVSWLFNKESEKALKRARASELALKRERDSLAGKVELKTKELSKQQTEKVVQLYKFAEFGKLTSGFLHDLSNSVNLISANLKQVDARNDDVSQLKERVRRAEVGVERLKTFVEATRKQTNNQDFSELFSLHAEIKQVIEIFAYKAKMRRVTINFKPEDDIKTFGNSVKFHQLISNLLSNAIDAYDGSRKKDRPVEIVVSKKGQNIQIVVRDKGTGISKKNIKYIFDPFFTTKGFKKGTGIGLSISKDIVQKDFKGTIMVQSRLKQGTSFTVYFPQQRKV